MSNIQPKFEGPSLKNEKVQNFYFSGPRGVPKGPSNRKFSFDIILGPYEQHTTEI